MNYLNYLIKMEELTIKPGAIYQLPIYRVTDNGLEKVDVQQINFVKGSTEGGERLDGIITEELLGVCLDYLQTVNKGQLANRQTAIAITKIEEALMWLEDRKRERQQRGVWNTYKP